MENIVESNLAFLNGDLLKEIAKGLGVWEKTHTKKDHYIRAITAFLRNQPAQFVGGLTKSEKNLLAEIVYSGRLPTNSQFQAKYSVKFPSMPVYTSRDSKPSALICFVSTQSPNSVCMSQEVLEAFKRFLPAPPAIQANILPAPPETYEGRTVHVFSGERHITAELGRILRLIQVGKIKVTDSTRRPTDASTRLIATALVQPDFLLDSPKEETKPQTEIPGPVRAHAWGVLVQQCGWAKPRAGCLTLTSAGKDILSAFTPEKFKTGVESFLGDDSFDELHRVNHIRGQSGKAKRYISNPGERRSRIKGPIASWPVGEWLSFDESFRLIAASGAKTNIFDSPQGSLFIVDAEYGEIYDDLEVFRQFLRAVVMESLATLGLVDIAWVYPHSLWPEFKDCYGRYGHEFLGRYDGLLAVRINSLGAYCFQLRETYAFTPSVETKRFHLLPNHDLTALETPEASDLAFLELISVRKSDSVWQLDAPTILQSMQQGTRLPDIREFLLRSARQGIPPNIEKWLEDFGEKAIACRAAHRAILLEWKDSAQAHLIATSSGTGKLCYHAGENRIAVPERQLSAFSREARKLGFLIPSPEK